ncbi:hypothetical protein Bca4012_026973 [Brassica carinata]
MVIRFRWSRLWYMAYGNGKLTQDGPTTPSDLVAPSLSHVFALFVAVSVGANVSIKIWANRWSLYSR